LEFKSLVPLFEDYRLIALDLRGFANSSYERKIDSLWDYVEDIKMLLKIKGIDDVIIVGNCLGGLIGKMFSSKYSKTVKALVLVGSIGVQGGADFFANEDSVPQSIEEIANSQIYKSMNRYTTVTDERDENSLSSMADYAIDGDTIRDILWALLNTNISPELYIHGIIGTNAVSKIKAPVLVIHGTNDTVIPLSQARIIYNLLGNKQCSFETITEAGHFPLQGHLNSTALFIRRFIDEKVPVYLYENVYKNYNLRNEDQSSVFYSFSFVNFLGAVFASIFGGKESITFH